MTGYVRFICKTGGEVVLYVVVTIAKLYINIRCIGSSVCNYCRMHPKAMKSLNKGAWSSDEDTLLRKCIHTYGEGKWHLVPQRAGLNRCRKSCRLRWLNYLRPTLRRGDFCADEVDLMMRLHRLLGNRWSLIAGRLPGRTGNDVKNFWNTKIQKKLTTANKKKEVVIRQELTHVVVKPLPRTLSKHTRISCCNEMNSSPGGEMLRNNMSNSNDMNMVIDKPPPDQDGIEWWKNVFAEIGIHGQEKDSSQGFLLASSLSGSYQNMDAERGLILEHQELSTPVTIEAAALLEEEEGRSSWCDFWDLLDSDFN